MLCIFIFGFYIYDSKCGGLEVTNGFELAFAERGYKQFKSQHQRLVSDKALVIRALAQMQKSM